MPHDPLFEEIFLDAPGSEVDLKKKHGTLSEIRCNVPFIDDPIYASIMDDDSEGDTTLIQELQASEQFEQMFSMGSDTSAELMKAAKSSKPAVTVPARSGTISVARSKSANLIRLEELLRQSRAARQKIS
jgi:hypothetical protein